MCRRGCKPPPGPSPPPPPIPEPIPQKKGGLWDCVSHICIPKLGGPYQTKKECERNCKLPPPEKSYWQCDTVNKKCFKTKNPDMRKKSYSTHVECATHCIINTSS